MGAAACKSCASSQTDSCLAWRAFGDDWQSLNERLKGVVLATTREHLPTARGGRVAGYSSTGLPCLKPGDPSALTVMTSDQAAQLIDNTLDLVHQRLLDLEAQSLEPEHKALAAEFREWRQPVGGHIDLMVFPGLTNS